jgi:hypothetical protein
MKRTALGIILASSHSRSQITPLYKHPFKLLQPDSSQEKLHVHTIRWWVFSQGCTDNGRATDRRTVAVGLLQSSPYSPETRRGTFLMDENNGSGTTRWKLDPQIWTG